jgi:ATP-dependent exoDNAse (exonuclease V) beta subunit
MAWHRIVTGFHERAEEKRILYVAATRASQRLILLNSHEGKKRARWRDALGALGYDASEAFPPDGPLCDGLVSHRRIVPEARQPEPGVREHHQGWAKAARCWPETSANLRRMTVPPASRPSGAGDRRAAEGDPEPDSEALLPATEPSSPQAARRAGTVVHAALEHWDFTDHEALRARADASLGRFPGPDGEAVAAEVKAILDGFLGSELPGRLARLAAGTGFPPLREVPLMMGTRKDEEGELWLGAADLIYRDEEGAWVVADYKTGQVRGDPSEAALEHADQLAVYARALKRAMPEETVRAEILFLRSGQAVPVDLPPDP